MSAGEVRLRKRYHPDGFVLWDVMLLTDTSERWIGVVRRHAVEAPSWFAYTLLSDEHIGRFPFRRDAVEALVERER